MLDSFLRQVTKDSYGPISFSEKTSIPAVVHKFNDGFSVLGWGRMPDPLPRYAGSETVPNSVPTTWTVRALVSRRLIETRAADALDVASSRMRGRLIETVL